MIYIASPYSHENKEVRQERYEKAVYWERIFNDIGFPVWSPIATFHKIAEQYNLPSDFEFWEYIDTSILKRCSELWVLKIDGWEQSQGVKAEIDYAIEHDIKIKYIEV